MSDTESSVDDDSESVGYTATLFLPATVRDSVGNVRGWMLGAPEGIKTADWEKAESVLAYIASIPTAPPSFNPDVIVSFEYDGRGGTFKRVYRTSLRNYLLLYAANITFFYYDVLGKHSEISVRTREFDARWADGDNDEDAQVDEYKWRWNLCERVNLSDGQRHYLAKIVKHWTRTAIGPTFTVDSPFPDADDFVPVYEAGLREFETNNAKRVKRSDSQDAEEKVTKK